MPTIHDNQPKPVTTCDKDNLQVECTHVFKATGELSFNELEMSHNVLQYWK